MSRKSPYLISVDTEWGNEGRASLWENKCKNSMIVVSPEGIIKLLLTKHLVYNRPCTGYLSYILLLIFTVTA